MLKTLNSELGAERIITHDARRVAARGDVREVAFPLQPPP